MEQAPVAAIYAMNDFYPIVTHCNAAQVDDPQVSQTSSDHQIAQTLRVRQVTFMKKEPTAFLVREEGFNLKTFFVPVNGLIRQFDIRHQINRMNNPPFPFSNHRDRTKALFCKPNLRNADLVVSLETKIIQRKLTSIFKELSVLGCATYTTPTFRYQSLLKFNSIKFPIPQKHHLTVLREDGL